MNVCRVQALILSPTRELAAQTEKVILAIGNFINIKAHSCIGGKSVGEDIRKLEYGVHVVSGTPGRVCDMIKRRTLRTRAIKLLILVSLSSLVFIFSVFGGVFWISPFLIFLISVSRGLVCFCFPG